MNAFASVTEGAVLPDWDCAQKEFDLWRGQCLDQYTKAERKISETLQILAKHFPKSVDIRNSYMFGQKLGLLREALLSGAEIDDKRAKLARDALDCFQQFADLRNCLCHGASAVFICRDCRWLVELSFINLGAAEVSTTQVMIESETAAQKLRSLRSAVQSLCAQLTNLGGSLNPPQAAIPSAPAVQASR
jgi:hypothetical protein